jgi:hypothetical protein
VGGGRSDSQVGADRGLVLVAEPLVDILVHERRLADAVSDETGADEGGGRVSTQEVRRRGGARRGAAGEGVQRRQERQERRSRSKDQASAADVAREARSSRLGGCLEAHAPTVAENDDLKRTSRSSGRVWGRQRRPSTARTPASMKAVARCRREIKAAKTDLEEDLLAGCHAGHEWMAGGGG